MQFGQARRRELRHLTYRIVGFAVGDFHLHDYLNDAEQSAHERICMLISTADS
jgi:hypothetical protein